MRWFRNLKIFRKLMLAFLISGGLTAALGAMALLRLHGLNAVITGVNDNWMPGMRLMLDMKATLAEYRIAEIQLVNRSDDTVLDDYRQRLKGFRDHIGKDLAEYAPLVTSPDERKLADAVKKNLADYTGLSDKIVALSIAHDAGGASALLNGDSKKLRRQAAESIDASAKYYVGRSVETGQQASHDYQRAPIALVVGTLLTVVIGLLLGAIIARSVDKPLRIAARTADAISRGELDGQITAETTDEAGRLLTAMKTMQNQLHAFISGLGTMAQWHEAGEISYRVPTDQLPGAYGAMAGQVNALVSSHIAVNSRVVEVVRRYAAGDFAIEMDRLPGEQARISESMDAVRAGFSGVNG